ncbi:hypothetical protein [Actibacterium sp. 188UL27-1]|uniref:hypothetical protein n=1 Tax=Actibacterium sp. 188UL27-1 TaxID=2786961 RepID=UPI00195982C3|nr:hypothetical protein [Actibacterium sp. 188UL27-1]MBM7067758.1 hypothetical protein [Actibacterium sp. 188UL27-1]
MDRHSAPIGEGVIAVAALFGIVGGTMLWVMWDYELVGAVFGGGCVAAVAGLVLWLGWRKPLPGPTGPRDLSPGASGSDGINVARDTGGPASSAPSAAPVAESAPDASAPATAPATTVSDPSVKPSSALAGEAELGERKGEWKYEANSTPASDPAPAEVAPAKEAPVSDSGDIGTRPEALEAPRDGNADDLKQIKGVGPKLEQLCNSLGFYHFDQIAGWNDAEVAWVDENLEGFKGRVSRDEWVDQAKILAAGGETAFSSKVEKGGVY